MAGISLSGVDWTYDSAGGSGVVQSPLAAQTLVSVPSAALPSGFYQMQCTVGLAKISGGTAGLLVDLTNFRLIVGSRDPITLCCFGEATPSTVEVLMSLDGTEGVEIRTQLAGTNNAVYVARIMLTLFRKF